MNTESMNTESMSTAQESLQTDHLICPLCTRTFRLGSEEYCPHDGERLQLKVVESVVAEPQPAVAAVAATVQAEQPSKPPPHAEIAASASPTDVPDAPQAHSTEAPPVQDATPSTSQAPGEPGPDLGMLGRLFEHFGIRRKTPQAQTEGAHSQEAQADGSAATAAAGASHDDTDNPLPESMVDAGWVISGAARSDVFADTWPVQRQGEGVLARYSRYRGRVLTSPALYRQLRQQSQHFQTLPAVLDAGTVNLRGHAQASYDLTVLPAHARSLQRLDEWLRLAPPSEQKAAALLPALAELLDDLHTIGVAPILMQPSQILRHDSGRLVLGHVAALTATETEAAVPEYRPELECNPMVSRLWAAPEIHEQLVVHPAKAAVFSVGQLLAAATWGQPLDLAALRSGQVPLHTLQDSRLARVLQGCLWAQHLEGRWSREQLSAAVDAAPDALPAAEDWSSLGPQAMGVAFAFNGRTYWRVSELLHAAVLPNNWPHATSQLITMLDWVEESTLASAVPALRALLAQGRSADYVLIRLVRQVCPDMPLTWRDLSLDDHSARNSLTHLAQRALAGDATPAERQQLRELFRADLRGAFSGA
jgi:hypothetical protein